MENIINNNIINLQAAVSPVTTEHNNENKNNKQEEPTIMETKIAQYNDTIIPQADFVPHTLRKEGDPLLDWGKEKTRTLRGGEVKSERGASRKVFAFGNGRYQAVLYPMPVHYMDQTGQWRDIDNTLTETHMDGKTFYENRGGVLKTRLAETADEKEAVRIIDTNGENIGWSYIGASHAPLTVECSSMPETEDEDLKRRMLPALESAARYAEAYPGVDIICRMRGMDFKDEMVLKNSSAQSVFSLALNAHDLSFEKDINDRIYGVHGKERVFELPPAFMKDAGGNIGQVETLLTYENGKPVMTMVCDEDYLKDAVYPVILDPTVRSTKVSNDEEDNYVCSKTPTTNLPFNDSSLVVANAPSSGNGVCYSFIKHKNLPPIRMANTITKAYLTMTTKYSQSSTVPIGIFEVTSSWNSQGITWNGMPSYESKAMDYISVSSGSGAQATFNFDISNLVRKWYQNGQLTTNNGVMLKSLNETMASSNTVTFYSSDNIYNMPVFTINYIANAGLFDYTEYDSLNCGRAGTGYVNLHNGNLILSRGLTETSGSRMPVSLGLYYNSCNGEADESGAFSEDTENNTYYIDERRYTAVDVGRGWKLSGDKFVRKQKIDSTTYYMFEDGDGSRHWFNNPGSSGGYDQSGLRMKMKVTSSQITIEDTQGVVMTFEPSANFGDTGRILSVADPVGNTMSYTYNSSTGRLTQITDGAGRVTSFAYNANGKLYSITTPDNVTAATFTYSGDLLTAVTDLGEGQSVYSYNTNGLLTGAVLKPSATHTQKAIHYTYTSIQPYRVLTASEEGSATAGGTPVQGASVSYIYGDCMTTVTDMSVSGGKKMVYHFNDYGNVAAVQDELGYAKFANYTDTSLPNHATEVSKLQRSVVNLLPNHSFEDTSDTNWLTALENSAAGTHSLATDQKRYGSRSAKMAKTNSVGAMARYIVMTVETGKTYTFSGYVKTSGSATCFARAVCGGVTTKGEPVQSTSDWTRVSVTFTTGASSATLAFVTGAASGNVWVDCAQLEESAIPNRYNLIRNGDFSRYNSSTLKPLDWTGYNENVADDKVVTLSSADSGLHPSYLSGSVLHMYSNPNKTTGFYQVIPVSGSKGDVFTVGGWAKGFSKPIKGEERKYCMRVNFGTSASGSWTLGANIDWNEEWTDWHYASGAVIAPIAYSYVRVDVSYQRNINEAWFDGITLFKEEFGKSFAYDENGNVTSASTLASSKAYATYDSYNNMLTYRQPGRSSSEKHTMTYGSTTTEQKKHLLNTETSPAGVINAYDYDSYGNQILARTRNSGKTLMMQSTKTITSDGNHVSDTYDARNLHTSYDVDTASDLTYTVMHPNGQTVEYAYDSQKRTTTVGAGVWVDNDNYHAYKNEYAYDKDHLTQVKHNTTTNTSDVVYSFGFDDLGRQTAVTVGSGATGETPATLSTNHYNAATQTLSDVTFGNGGKVAYGYDDFKRVTGVKYDNETSNRFAYAYNADGRVGKVTDNNLGRAVWNEYDLADRPARLHIADGSGNVLYRTKLSYDAYNNLSEFDEEVGDGSGNTTGAYTTTYTYDADNRPTAVQFGAATEKVAYTYDVLGRIATRKQYNGNSSTPKNSATYSYLPGGQSASGYTSTTPLVSDISQNGVSFSYGYASNSNNITSETRTGGSYAGATTYEYDTLGQLTRVNDPTDTSAGSGGTTWVYEYDRGGNMLSKKGYAYTTGTLDSAVIVWNYTYDTAWKDKLISNGGYPLTYDAIGNLSTYGGWTYTWEAGRQLKRQVQNNTVVEYEYDNNGMRVRKTYKHTSGYVWATTNYTYNGKLLTHLEKNGDNMHFFYDAQGRPAMVDFNGTKYHYLYNLQGDVIGMVDNIGSLVVEYKYNAWGSILGTSTLTTAYSTLASMNPFRYRGYVYDEETWMYYCRARYYYPELQRWINADDISNDCLLKHGNLFTYCLNNPSNMTDSEGSFPFFAITAAIGAAVGAVVGGVYAAATGGNVLAGMGIGAVAGAVIGSGVGLLAGATLAGSLTASTSAVVLGTKVLSDVVHSGGSGFAYIWQNLQGAFHRVPVEVNHMRMVYTRGRSGEIISGITKNTQHIVSLTHTASYRIPDGLDNTLRIMYEVKNYSGTLSYTAQLRDFVLYAQQEGYQIILYTNAHLSGPLQEVVNSGIIKVIPLR